MKIITSADEVIRQIKTIAETSASLEETDLQELLSKQSFFTAKQLKDQFKQHRKTVNLNNVKKSSDPQIETILNEIRMPNGYRVTGSMIVKWHDKDTGTWLPVSNFVVITARIKDLYTGHLSYEIAFKTEEGINCAIVDAIDLAERRRITALAKNGVDVTSVNADAVISFLQLQKNASSQYLKTKLMIKTPGWHEYDGIKLFCLGNKIYAPASNHDFIADTQSPECKAWSQRGDFQKWLEVAQWVLQHDIPLFTFGTNFVAPLLKVLNITNSVFHNWGGSTGGKSFNQEFQASSWGSPEPTSGQIRSWKSSVVGLEGMMKAHSDLVLFLDESSHVESPKDLAEAIYMLGQGTSKSRGNKDGSLKKGESTRLITQSNGEQPLDAHNSKQGQLVRLVQINDLPFGERNPTTGEMLRKLRSTIRENYGFVGEIMIPKIVQIYNDSDKVSILENRLHISRKLLTLTTDSPFGTRVADYFAAVSVSLELLSEALPQLEITNDRITHVVEQMFDKQLKRLAADNQIENRALSYIWDKILAEPHRFDSESHIEKWGCITSNRSTFGKKGYAFHPSTLEKLLRDGGFQANAIMPAFKAKKYVWTKGNEELWPVKIDGVTKRLYVFSREEAEEAGVLECNNAVT